MQLKKRMALILLVMRDVDILTNLFGLLSSIRVRVKLMVKVSLYKSWRYIEGSRCIAPFILGLGASWRRGLTYEEARKLLS